MAIAFELSGPAKLSRRRNGAVKRAFYQGLTSVMPQNAPKKNSGLTGCGTTYSAPNFDCFVTRA
jgi:hypothetical protein